MLPTVHLFRTSGDDRLAVISLEPSSTPGAWLIRLARGKVRGKLGGTVYGPYPASAVRARYDEIIASLEGDGFVRAGRADTFTALTSSDPSERARAALRIGWRKDRHGVGPLIAALAVAKRDAPSMLDALGMIGDPSAIDAVRPHAEKQLLSRRRSAVEALRNLGDVEGLAQARQRGIARLPANVAQALGAIDEHDVRTASLAPLLDVLKDLDLKERAQIADVLYEADTPVTVMVALRLLRSIPFDRPHAWRYAKSIYKRAMLRGDARVFGWISVAIEQRARVSKGSKEVLKSGLDGEKRETSVFSKRTQAYVRRSGWRYLRRLARWRPDRYADCAAEILASYGPEDLRAPKGLIGRYGECYLGSRILWGSSDRFAFDTRSMRVRFKSSKAVHPPSVHVREEAYPELWDARPRAYLRVASASKLPEVLEFAARGIARHPEIVKDAGTKTLIGLFTSGHDSLKAIAIAEIERRFDPRKPDASLLAKLIAEPSASELGKRLAEASAQAWAIDPSALVTILKASRGAIAVALAQAASAVLTDHASARRAAAIAVLDALRAPDDGGHDALSELARRALLRELEALTSTDDLLIVLGDGSNAARRLAGALLGRRPDAFAAIGVDKVRALAESELIAVRRAAHAMLETAAPSLSDASILFVLAESAWDDTRKVALTLLRDTVGLDRLGLDGWIGLCDSRWPDVRALGREVVTKHFDAIDPQEALFKLVEHPSRDMRRFALTLIEDHLKPGFVPLSRIEGFAKAVLLDLSPGRAAKRRLIALLIRRGEADERQAELVLSLLSSVVRTRTVQDFERILAAMTAIRLAQPEAPCEAIEVRA